MSPGAIERKRNPGLAARAESQPVTQTIAPGTTTVAQIGNRELSVMRCRLRVAYRLIQVGAPSALISVSKRSPVSFPTA